MTNRNRRPRPNSSPASWKFERQISSDPLEGVAAIREVLSRLQADRWSEGEIFGIHLSLEEAVCNAINHGNAQDRQKTVRIKCETTADSFYAQISDQGPGFNPEAVPDPTACENLERPCGRGVMLMRCYMDNVSYSSSGNTVELFKKRSADTE